MDEYDDRKHVLLELIRHKWRLDKTEYASLLLKVAKVEVVIPEWPPVEYPPLQIGGGNPFDDTYVTGTQLAVSKKDERKVNRIAKEMIIDFMEQKRLAYQWQVVEFDSTKHVVIRSWLAQNEVSIVDFYRKFLPQLRKRLGRDVIIEVTNPEIREENKKQGGYKPTTRAVSISDIEILKEFAGSAKRFEYPTVQTVSWIRSLDDTRWEARRQHEPQSKTWLDYNCYIQRSIGDGAWTELDRGDEGHAHGPRMELWDDGTFHVWVMRRAIDFGVAMLTVNGVDIPIKPEGGVHVWRMAGKVSQDEVAKIVGTVYTVQYTKPDIELVVKNWQTNGVFTVAVDKPAECYRKDGRPHLVIRKYADAADVRVWGNNGLANGFILNGEVLSNVVAWQDGWKCRISLKEMGRILASDESEDEETEDEGESSVVDGVKVYSANSVLVQLRKVFGNELRVFGRTFSDSAIVALSKSGLSAYLEANETDRDRYIADQGNRNYDCENFAEQLRCGLQTRYGVNGVGIIWGDGHAWNFFVVKGSVEPQILMVEPQTDRVVTAFDGIYSIDRRCEVLL